MLKGREIEAEIRNRGFEKGVIYVLREQQEAMIAIHQQQVELANAFMKLADAVNTVAGGYQMLRQQTERMSKNIKFETDFDGDKG